MIEIALIAIALLVITLTLGVPLPYCFGAALMVMYFLGDVTMKGMILWGSQQLGNPVLLAIPLFVLAGTIMSESGIAAALLRFVNAFVGHVRGGLGVVAAVSCAVIGAISGSGLTGIAAIGPLLIPEMEKRGYPREYATALIANSSILGLLIPPSVTMIVYGWVTDTSILACFLATLGPGLLIMVAFSVINIVMSRKFNLVLDDKPSFSELSGEVARRGVFAFPALLMPAILLSGIYGGVTTPTEAAAVAAFYALILAAFFYRALRISTLYSILVESARSSAAIGLVIGGALILNYIVASENIPNILAQRLADLDINPILFLVGVNLLLLILGCILDATTIILVILPLFLPTCRELGIDLVHFGVIAVVNCMIGLITPPYGMLLFVLNAVTRIPLSEIIHEIWPFLLALLLALLGLVIFPELVLWLPQIFGYDG